MLLESLPNIADDKNSLERKNLNKLDLENDDDAETGTDSIC